MNESTLEMLKRYMANQRELNKAQPFLSEFEQGVREAVNDVLDDMENILAGNFDKAGVK